MRITKIEIGLNAGATARVGTGDSKNAERASVGERHESTCGRGWAIIARTETVLGL
jgi:hypothetical protein